MSDNPFDALDGTVIEPGAMMPGPPPSLLERFRINREAGYYSGTVSGAVQGKYAESFERERALQRYENFPQWETPLEGMAALAGQLSSQLNPFEAPENFIPLTVGAKVLNWGGRAILPSVRARIAGGAIDASIVNLVTDTAIQGIEMGAGTREAFDPVQLAASVALGAAVGGVAGGVVGVATKAAERAVTTPRDAAAPVPFSMVRPELPSSTSGEVAATFGPESKVAAAPTQTPEAGGAAPPPDEIVLDTITVDAVPDVTPVSPATLGETLDAKAREVRDMPPRAVPTVETTAQMVRKEMTAEMMRGAPPVPRRPETLSQFLAREGGIRDAGGELAARDLSRWFGPGGRLVRRTGLSLDEARRRAVSAGYLDDTAYEGGVSTSTVNDLLQALDEDVLGSPVYSRRDTDLVEEWNVHQSYEEARGKLENALREVEAAITSPVSKPTFRRAVEIAASERVDGADALERAIMEDYYSSQTGPHEVLTYDDGQTVDLPPYDVPGMPEERGGTLGEGQDLIAGDRRAAIADRERSVGAGGAEGFQVERTDARTQSVVRGAERASHAAMAQRGADAPLRPGIAQQAADEGLFGDGHKQSELFAAAHGALAGSLTRNAGGTGTFRQGPGFTRLMDVANRLVNALEGTVRQGRISSPKALGVYKTPSGTIRVRKPDDFEVLSHELGHHLEEMIGKPIKSLMDAHRAELVPMAYAGAKKGTELKEGFAEFTRLMLTNPAYARLKAPGFDRALRSALSQGEHADIRRAIDEAAAAYKAWLDQPSTEAVASTIVSAKEPGYVARARKELDRYGLGHTISDYLSRAYTIVFDDLNPLNQAVRALASTYRDNKGKPLDLKVSSDPYKLARMSRGAWNAGHIDITSGVYGYRGTMPVSPSLRDAVILAMGKPNALSRWDDEMATRFGGYLWSRRAIGEWNRFDKGEIPNPPDKLTRGDHLLNIQEMEAAHPQFQQAASMVHDWARALWEKKRDAGLITHEQWQEGLNIVDYVPGQRMFDQDYDPPGVAGKPEGSRKAGFVRRFRGSSRDVINPVESLMRDAYETSMAIARNDVIKALDRLAIEAGPGGGRIAERIPAHEIRASVIDPLEAVESAAKAAGMAKQDIVALRDAVEAAVGDEKAAIFRPAIINEKGEPIAFFRDGGELKALRLADGEFGRDMYRALTGMSQIQRNIFVEMLAKPASVLRLGIVADPAFVFANFIRDQAMGWVFYGQPLKRLKGTIRGMLDDLFVTDAARSYNSAQGIMGGAAVAGIDDLRVKRDISELKRQGWAGSRLTSLRGILSITELSETGGRIALFDIFKQEAKKRGLTEIEAVMEASWRSRDYIDFNRHGSQMAGMSRLIPFFNASLQGLDKFTRQTIAPFFRETLTAEDARAKGEAVKAWARMAAATVFSTALYALNSQHEEFQDLSPETKATHWMFKFGDKWVAIPKPFEAAALFNLGEAAWDAAAMRDPRWTEQYIDGLLSVTLPPNLMEGNPTVAEAYTLATGHDVRTGRPVVPDELQGMEPWLQYTAQTSDLSRDLGRITNTSPAIIDHIVLAHTGSYGRNALALYDWALSDKPMPGWDDMPLLRRFIKDDSRGASSTRAFWDLVSERTGELEGSRRTWQALNDGGDAMGAADYLASLDTRTKVWIAAGSIDADARRLHPLVRARSAVRAIGDLRREMMDGYVSTGEGTVEVPRADRGVADDVLADLAMMESRNALVMIGEPGWANRQVIDTATYHRELEAVSPQLTEALAARFASGKVLPFTTIAELWPELEQRLVADGSQAITEDLAAIGEAEGFELDGIPLPRKQRAEVGPDLKGLLEPETVP